MGSPGPGVPSPPLTVAPVFFQSIIFDEVDLTDASVAESSTKNVNNSFTVSLWTTPLSIPLPRVVFLFNLNGCV